jgi:hypothetical protein
MTLFEGDPDPGTPDDLVIVGRFEDPTEAQMAKGMLESAGVDCFLAGENVNNLMPAAFRVRLLVKVEDESAARELLKTSEEASKEDSDGS